MVDIYQVGLHDPHFVDIEFNFKILLPFLINKPKKKLWSWDSFLLLLFQLWFVYHT